MCSYVLFTFHPFILIAWLADVDFLMCYIVMMGRLIAQMFPTFSLWGCLFIMNLIAVLSYHVLFTLAAIEKSDQVFDHMQRDCSLCSLIMTWGVGILEGVIIIQLFNYSGYYHRTHYYFIPPIIKRWYSLHTFGSCLPGLQGGPKGLRHTQRAEWYSVNNQSIDCIILEYYRTGWIMLEYWVSITF